MCLDKRMRVSASAIAIYCATGGGIRHFFLIPAVFAVTSGPSFTKAERGVCECGNELISPHDRGR